MTSPTDNQPARPRDNLSNSTDDARFTASASETSRSAGDAACDDAAWEAEVDRIAKPAFSLEDTLHAILNAVDDDAS